jgi:hypothetical protein
MISSEGFSFYDIPQPREMQLSRAFGVVVEIGWLDVAGGKVGTPSHICESPQLYRRRE